MDDKYLLSVFSNVAIQGAKVFHHKNSSFGFLDFDSNDTAGLSLQSFNGLKMPKSKKVFKLNWASSEPREKKPAPKLKDQENMGKSTSKVSST